MFKVFGKKFFSIGGQFHNSTTYVKEDMRKGFEALKQIGGNTIAAPVMWEEIEKEEGVFDFQQLHNIVELAREYQVHLVVLWFGSWKNGMSHYVPSWVKSQKDRFDFVETSLGAKIRNLSCCSKENVDADKKAFVELVKEIERINDDETIIAVQVENEPGIIGQDRDYSCLANGLFEKNVPSEILQLAKEKRKTEFSKDFEKNGSKENCNWQETFALYAGEYFTAYYLSKYVEDIARSGKEFTKLPMYTNVWLKDMYMQIPGSSYPSGGATWNVLDIWKKFAPSLDLIAPDIYIFKPSGYQKVCDEYSRDDNMLYIPESMPCTSNALNMFKAIEKENLVGFHCFSIDSVVKNSMQLNVGFCGEFIKSMMILKNIVPLLNEREGKLVSVVQEEFATSDYFEFDDYIVLVKYFGKEQAGLDATSAGWLDTFHSTADPEDIAKMGGRGRGIINYKGNGEFYFAGCGFRAIIAKKTNMFDLNSNLIANEWMATRQWNYISVEEGKFDEAGQFVVLRKRNGDETDSGLWVTPDIGIVKVKMD